MKKKVNIVVMCILAVCGALCLWASPVYANSVEDPCIVTEIQQECSVPVIATGESYYIQVDYPNLGGVCLQYKHLDTSNRNNTQVRIEYLEAYDQIPVGIEWPNIVVTTALGSLLEDDVFGEQVIGDIEGYIDTGRQGRGVLPTGVGMLTVLVDDTEDGVVVTDATIYVWPNEENVQCPFDLTK